MGIQTSGFGLTKMAHRTPWTERDEVTLYRCIAAGMLQEQIAERLGRTKRAIRWKVGNDRTLAAVSKGVEGSLTPSTQGSDNSKGSCRSSLSATAAGDRALTGTL